LREKNRIFRKFFFNRERIFKRKSLRDFEGWDFKERKQKIEHSHIHSHTDTAAETENQKQTEFVTEEKLKSEMLFLCWICSTLCDSTVQLKSEVSFKILYCASIFFGSYYCSNLWEYWYLAECVTAVTAETYFFYLHFQVYVF